MYSQLMSGTIDVRAARFRWGAIPIVHTHLTRHPGEMLQFVTVNCLECSLIVPNEMDPLSSLSFSQGGFL